MALGTGPDAGTVPARPAIADVEVIAPNFKERLSGVTSTIAQLVPMQASMVGIAALGPGLPDTVRRIGYGQLPGLLGRPRGRPFRIWHARRNVEMLAGVILRDVLRAPLRLVFTSAAQRHHRGWTRFLIRRMDAVIATTAKAASYLERPARVILHGIDLSRFSPPASRELARSVVGLDPAQRYIGCFGRVRAQKGVDLFVDAMLAILPSRPGWSAVISGRTTTEHVDFEANLKQRIAAAGLSERIRFVGEVEDIRPWFQAMDLYVAPQRWEGFGLTPLEAMACGVPVVATDVGAFPEIVLDGVTGRVVPREDVPALVGACIEFLDDGVKREEAGRQGVRHVHEAFPLEREAREIVEVYESLWAGRPVA